MPPLQVFLGPLLGFLFTTGTLLFVILNAHRTVPTTELPSSERPEEAPVPNMAPVEPMGPDGTGLGGPSVHAVEPNEPTQENS
jgi:hypothetical protein